MRLDADYLQPLELARIYKAAEYESVSQGMKLTTDYRWITPFVPVIDVY